MELKQYALILWRWLWLIILGAALAAVTAYVVSSISTPVYAASSTLLISQAPSDKVSDYTAILTSERLARTYSQMLTGVPVMKEAITTLKLNIEPADLAKQINVTLVRDTQLIKVTVESEDPQIAMKLANLIPQIFSRQNASFQVDRYADSKANLSKELDSLNAQIRQIQLAIDRLGQPTSAEGKAELARLQTEMAQYRQSVTSLLQSYENIRLAEAQSTNDVVVVEPAELPIEPIRPRTLVNTALAAAVGMMLAVGIVFLIEYLDDSIRSPEQIHQLLQAPVVTAIAKMPAASLRGGPIASVEPRSPITEAFRGLRTSLQFTSLDKPIKTIVVTSAGAGEGKTTIASNLAIVMAQAGMRVVLIDADLRRPSIHKTFSRPNRNGLTDLMLQGAAGWNGAVQETSIRNLFLISSGQLPPNPSEILASQKMRQLLDHFSKVSDMVIIDTPPALAVTDATVLAPNVDAVLLVVDTGATRIGAVAQVKTQFEQVGVKLLGVVMNKIQIGRGNGYHYYNYYYYYNAESADGGEKKKGFRWPWERRRPHHTPESENAAASPQ
ncbi:MAG: polysaccharide biosynthesis tyrosine autokinase [Nitrospirae bacterium]|nr:polysaccharide biosynthesis tyrosine autokinase [Nitrospirota bacterium]